MVRVTKCQMETYRARHFKQEWKEYWKWAEM